MHFVSAPSSLSAAVCVIRRGIMLGEQGQQAGEEGGVPMNSIMTSAVLEARVATYL